MVTRSFRITSASLVASIVAALAATPAFAQDKAAPDDKAATSGASSTSTARDTTAAAPATAPPRPVTPLVEPPKEESKTSDVIEQPGKTYYYLGLRYRGTIVPKFIQNLFVDEGATVYSNTVGMELDIRKDGFSLIPALSYTEYGTDNILFLEKGKPASLAGNWNNVKSSLKGLYATADLLWSVKVSRNVDFEYGAGFGLGLIVGDLETSWVYADPNGPYHASTGQNFSPCTTATATNLGCNVKDHSGASTARINHYVEPGWFSGGSRPSLFLHLSVPQFGLRIKPAKDFQARVGLGFSLTGFWFGLSADYGLERVLEKKKAP